MIVSLSEISRANVRTVCELELADEQQQLVAPASFTVAEGRYEPDAILRAIYADDDVAGVLLVMMEGNVPYLVRFMIGASSQGRGIGRQAVELLAADLRQRGCVALETTFVPRQNGSEAFWRKCGFTDTGRRNWAGEPIFVLHLAAAPS